MAMFVELIFTAIFMSCAAAATPPKWPTTYNISGTIRLPYAEINEPFTAWYDTGKNRTRVDYYNSSVITIQIGCTKASINGTSYKIAPVYMNERNLQKCFQVNGTKNETMAIQSVLPDLVDFHYIGVDTRLCTACSVWQKVEKIGGKKNTYTMWVSDDGQPVRYQMMGYDTLLGSHYDKYYLDYNTLNVYNGSIPDTTFTPTKGMTCGDFPGPGDQEHRVTMNPMLEYVHHDDRHIDDMFDTFKKTHEKQYDDLKEHDSRKHQFRQNVRYIHSKNRAGLSYSLKVNHLADMNDREMSRLRGYRANLHGDSGAIHFSELSLKVEDAPESVDWRLYGAVTPVKDQAVCGSCWSFGTAGAVEGAYFIKTGELVRLSQQELMDCTWDQGNNGCDGGEDYRAYQWIKQHGLATEEDYGPYLSQDGYCRYKNVTSTVFIKGYVNVTVNDEQALRLAIANYGPVSVAIDASHKSLSFYANGVYYEPDCGNTPDDLDHAVLAVGYGVLNGQAYWLIKNSWSTYWGNSGYVLMSAAENNCGVASSPTFVLM